MIGMKLCPCPASYRDLSGQFVDIVIWQLQGELATVGYSLVERHHDYIMYVLAYLQRW
uniref:Uncharacterized protein n=1 Tax=Arundo donax TaxID=35708 RepID=A0A0A9BFS2_ARUDO